MVLQRAGAARTFGRKLASAFDTAYWWALGIAALSLIPCVVLLRAENPRARLDARGGERRGDARAGWARSRERDRKTRPRSIQRTCTEDAQPRTRPMSSGPMS